MTVISTAKTNSLDELRINSNNISIGMGDLSSMKHPENAKVFTHTVASLAGAIVHGNVVTGLTSGATGVVAGVVTVTQVAEICITDIVGTFQSGEVVQVSAGNTVTLSDAGTAVDDIVNVVNASLVGKLELLSTTSQTLNSDLVYPSTKTVTFNGTLDMTNGTLKVPSATGTLAINTSYIRLGDITAATAISGGVLISRGTYGTPRLTSGLEWDETLRDWYVKVVNGVDAAEVATTSKMVTRLNAFELFANNTETGVDVVWDSVTQTFDTAIQANAVALGTQSTGAYVKQIIATANQTTVSSNNVETSDVTIGLVANPIVSGLTAGNITTGVTTDNTLTTTTGNLVIDAATNIVDVNAATNIVGNTDITGILDISSHLVVGGNLTVNGTTTTVNSNTINVADNTIVLNNDVVGVPTESGGIELERGTYTNASLLWDETGNRWTTVTPVDDAIAGIVHNVMREGIDTVLTLTDGDTTSVALDSNDTLQISSGSGIVVNYTDSTEPAFVLEIAHADTSSQGSVNNSAGNVIQDITLDTFGHISTIASADLDNRYMQLGDQSNTALKWTTARTVTFATGDVTGNFTIDGSADVSDVSLVVADNSHNHSGGTISGLAATAISSGTLPTTRGGTGTTSVTGTSSLVKSASPTFTGTVGFTSMTGTTVTAALVGNASTASAWATARSISLGGNATGTVSIDGSGDVTLTASVSQSTNATYLSSTAQTSHITGITSGLNAALNNTSANGSFTCKSTGTGDSNLAGLSFHNNSYGIKLGVRNDGTFGLGGWNRAAWSWYSSANGDMVAAGNLTAYSDPRLKDVIGKIESPIEKLMQLDGVDFTWKSGIAHTECKAGTKDIGVLADQVEAVFPEIVSESIEIDGDSYKTVSYDKLVAVLIEAVKELNSKIKVLENK